MSDVQDACSAGQYLSFQLAGSACAVPIRSVREIRIWEALTAIPQAPHWLRGVLNLRGSVVPVMDLRAHMELGAVEVGRATVILIVEHAEHLLGLLVDAVSDVEDITCEQISSASEAAGALAAGTVRGIALLDERVLMLLDVAVLVVAVDERLIGTSVSCAAAA